MGVKLLITDERMLESIQRLKDLNIASSQKEVCDAIGIEPQRIYKIRDGKQHFIAENIRLMSKTYNIPLDYLFGFSNQFFDKKKVNKNVNRDVDNNLNIA